MWSVIGQKKAVSLLQRSLDKGSLSHAYLFVGPAHVGKMKLAQNLAQALNCPAAEPPCGQCLVCHKIASARHADVQIIALSHSDAGEAGSRMEIGIEQIEQLQHSASLPPFEGRYKVFIIDGAEYLSQEAANCLLKTLEEPNARIVFILLTVNDRLLLPTVVSRCQRLELHSMPVSEVENALVNRWNMEPNRAAYLARLSHGCLGWAVLAADEPRLVEQREQKLSDIVNIINGSYGEGFAYATQLASQFGRSRSQVQETLDLWLDFWRDILMVKAGCAEMVTNTGYLAALTSMSSTYSLVEIRGFIREIQATKEELKRNVNPKLAFEVLILNIPRREGRGIKSPGARS